MGTAAYGNFWQRQQAAQNANDAQLKDEFRKQRSSQYDVVSKNIQGILASGVDPHTQQPLTDEQKQGLQGAMNTVLTYQKNLGNPDFDPQKGEVPEEPIHRLTTAMHITKDTHPAPGQQIDDLNTILGQYGAPAEVNPALKAKRVAKEAGATPEEQELAGGVAGGYRARPISRLAHYQVQNYKLKDGTTASVKVNTTDPSDIVDTEGNPVADGYLEGAVRIGTGGTALPKVGTLGDFIRQAYGDHATASQILDARKRWAEAAASSTTGTHIIQVPQPDGTIKSYEVTTTSSKHFSGAPMSEVAPGVGITPTGTTPKGTVPKPSASPKMKEIGVTGGKLDKDLQDTGINYEAAVDRQKTMHDNFRDAIEKGDQQAMLSLVANHIGMTLGAQKGARINQAVWNEAVASTPWLEKIDAKFDDRGYLSGVTLAPEQMASMVRLADEKVEALAEHKKRAQENVDKKMGVIAPAAGKTVKIGGQSYQLDAKNQVTVNGHLYQLQSDNKTLKLVGK